MEQGRDISAADRRRNERLAGLRRLVAADRAVVGIDLADRLQEVVVVDHDRRVLARRTERVRAWELGPALGWAVEAAARAGFGQVVVACEPTGHRWRAVAEQCDAAGLPMVCVQPLLVAREREREDLTHDRSDRRDAVLIAGLAVQLRCYVPERAEQVWARLRHLGARRAGLVVRTGAARQQVAALLECAWPAVLEAAGEPLRSTTWRAALEVVLDRTEHGDLAAARPRLRRDRFDAAVRRQVTTHGGSRVCWRIAHAVRAAVADPGGVATQRQGAFERLQAALADLDTAQTEQADVEARMVDVLDQLDLTDLATSIDGVTAVGAATILAETGDPARFATARSLVKHAGLAPRDNASGTFTGATTISRRGRPQLRLAAWRVAWGALPHNPVLKARYEHLTGRPDNQLTDQQARVAIAGSLLRQLHAVLSTRTPWDPDIAAGRRPTTIDQEARLAA